MLLHANISIYLYLAKGQAARQTGADRQGPTARQTGARWNIGDGIQREMWKTGAQGCKRGNMVPQGEERKGQTARGKPPDRQGQTARGQPPDRQGQDRHGVRTPDRGKRQNARQGQALSLHFFQPPVETGLAPVSPLPLSLLFPCLSSSPSGGLPLSGLHVPRFASA